MRRCKQFSARVSLTATQSLGVGRASTLATAAILGFSCKRVKNRQYPPSRWRPYRARRCCVDERRDVCAICQQKRCAVSPRAPTIRARPLGPICCLSDPREPCFAKTRRATRRITNNSATFARTKWPHERQMAIASSSTCSWPTNALGSARKGSEFNELS